MLVTDVTRTVIDPNFPEHPCQSGVITSVESSNDFRDVTLGLMHQTSPNHTDMIRELDMDPSMPTASTVSFGGVKFRVGGTYQWDSRSYVYGESTASARLEAFIVVRPLGAVAALQKLFIAKRIEGLRQDLGHLVANAVGRTVVPRLVKHTEAEVSPSYRYKLYDGDRDHDVMTRRQTMIDHAYRLRSLMQTDVGRSASRLSQPRRRLATARCTE